VFGLSFGELVIVAILALVLLGPDRLPEAAKTIGKTLKDFKKATDGLKDQIETELYSAEKSIEKYVNAPDVPPVVAAAAARSLQPAVPATAENVPGLEAALVDPAPAPPPPPPGPAEPA
jgi:sec-independent protein translocase protein TatB